MDPRILIAAALLVACGSSPPPATPSTEPTYELGKADGVTEATLDAFHPALRGDALLFDPSIVEGGTEANVFSSSWWPHRRNGLAWRWSVDRADDTSYDVSAFGSLRPEDLSPVEKYDLLFEHRGVFAARGGHGGYVEEVTNSDGTHPAIEAMGPATAWTLRHRGRWRTAFPANWEGYCNGWSAYSTTEPLGAPQRDVRVRLDSGAPVECAADESGCVMFRMADMEALMIGVYFDDDARTLGGTCWTASWERDDLGRPLDRDCRDVNPADFHIVLTTFLHHGIDGERRPFIVDHVAGPDIWNFPVVSFASTYGPLMHDRGAAASLVCSPGTRCDADAIFEPSASQFVVVDTTYVMVSDDVDATELARPASERHIEQLPVDVRYLLELQPEGDSLRIIGGHWLGASVDEHPDIVWYSRSHRSYRELPNDGNSSWETPYDNPHLRYDFIAALVECANDPASCSSTAAPVEDNPCAGACGDHVELADGSSCSCDPCCYVYGNCCDADGSHTSSRRSRDQVCSDECWFGEP